ncbi:unnamed protein product [Cuscuta europaea]|uniref:Uncharacterized protein n=1 Tax=Cuscuta europaea TaxID=41803 RepID=A0A9P0ZW27_CUSEU|nr:unnamed protein product [Cuscuta europaea]
MREILHTLNPSYLISCQSSTISFVPSPFILSYLRFVFSLVERSVQAVFVFREIGYIVGTELIRTSRRI